MAYKLKHSESTLEGNDSFVNEKKDHECVIFVQQVAGAPPTPVWRKGKKVLDLKPGEITFGTVIATFDEKGKYPLTDRHAAIYVSHNNHEIIVYDQWNKKGKVTKRTIRLKKHPHRNVDDANYYFVVE